jgi:hypothetical protein
MIITTVHDKSVRNRVDSLFKLQKKSTTEELITKKAEERPAFLPNLAGP